MSNDPIDPAQLHRTRFAAMTLNAEPNQKAKAILIRELGPVDYARFLLQNRKGTGDSSYNRHQWLPEETSSTLHSQTALLAANGRLPRPEGAKTLSKIG